MFPSNRTRSLLHIFCPTVTLCHIIMPTVLCLSLMLITAGWHRLWSVWCYCCDSAEEWSTLTSLSLLTLVAYCTFEHFLVPRIVFIWNLCICYGLAWFFVFFYFTVMFYYIFVIFMSGVYYMDLYFFLSVVMQNDVTVGRNVWQWSE
jgi:hypothetical protein